MPGLRSKATVTGTLPLEAALVKNADGSAISNPVFADCTFDAGSSQWICDTPAPDGTYQVGAQLMRLKGSSPAVTALSDGPRTVTGGGTGTTPTPLATPTNFRQDGTDANGKGILKWDAVANATGYRLLQGGSVQIGVGTATSYAVADGSYQVQALFASDATRNSAYSTTVQVTAVISNTDPAALGYDDNGNVLYFTPASGRTADDYGTETL